jgi:HSP20 family protein
MYPFEAISNSFEAMWDLIDRSLEPLAEVIEDEKSVRVTVDLPFVNKKDIKIKLVGDMLEIDAGLQRCVTFNKWGTVQKHCEFRSFHKSIRLPTTVTTIGAKASFKKGILVIYLPKTEAEHDVPID